MVSTEQFTKWLEQFINFERDPKKELLNLEKMGFYAAHFGNPQDSYPCIHVAGSKGKGSVSTMIASCLTEAGYKTGLYTSPHVADFRERVSCAGTFFSDEAYSRAYLQIIEGFEHIIAQFPNTDPTWFEIVTMLSFVIFKNEHVDYAVFEVGLGGRLDTTNIIKPRICAIMPIELEHTQYLGNTIAKIAFEKAGIIKKNIPFFCFEQKDEALDVFKKASAERFARMFYLPDFVKDVSYKVTPDGLQCRICYNEHTTIGALFDKPLEMTLRLTDEIQAKNAALAAALVKYLLPNLEPAVLERGLAKTWLLGRFEIIQKSPLTILDGAHTVNSLSLSISTFQKLTDKKGILVFACAEDKNVHAFAPLFDGKFDTVYLTIPGLFKKSNLSKLDTEMRSYFSDKSDAPKLVTSPDFKSILKQGFAESAQTGKPLLIAGSFYLVGEAKKIFASQE